MKEMEFGTERGRAHPSRTPGTRVASEFTFCPLCSRSPPALLRLFLRFFALYVRFEFTFLYEASGFLNIGFFLGRLN